MKFFSTCGPICAALLVLCSPLILRAQSAAFRIDHYVLASAGTASRNACFRLDGTAGQAAPGYSSNATFAIVAGYWAAMPRARDEIFFSSFEGC